MINFFRSMYDKCLSRGRHARYVDNHPIQILSFKIEVLKLNITRIEFVIGFNSEQKKLFKCTITNNLDKIKSL